MTLKPELEISFIGITNSKRLKRQLSDVLEQLLGLKQRVTLLKLTIRPYIQHRGTSPIRVAVHLEVEGESIKVKLHAPRRATNKDLQLTARKALDCALKRIADLNEIETKTTNDPG